MKTYSRLTLAFLLLILVVPQVCADEPPKDGPYVEYYENGQKVKGHFKNGRLVSASVWKPDGEPCPISKIVDGSGILVGWHTDGQKDSETHYKNGKQDGLVTQWRENGQKRLEVHHKNGELDGLVTQWRENGQKRLEVHHKNNKLDGLWTEWHENGQKSGGGHYKNGELDGLATEWDKDGNKILEIHYKNSKEVSRKEF